MRSEIIDIHRKIGATTIYVTHDQTEAMTMADRIVVMKDGYIQQVGTPYELYFNPVNVFVAGFIGEPPMNFIKGEVSDNSLLLNQTDVNIPLNNFELVKSHKNVIFGFRPEAAILESHVKDEEGIMIEALVEVSELLGDNTNVYAKIGDNNIVIKIDPHDTPKMGDAIRFLIPYKSMYFFDQEDEKVIK